MSLLLQKKAVVGNLSLMQHNNIPPEICTAAYKYAFANQGGSESNKHLIAWI